MVLGRLGHGGGGVHHRGAAGAPHRHARIRQQQLVQPPLPQWHGQLRYSFHFFYTHISLLSL